MLADMSETTGATTGEPGCEECASLSGRVIAATVAFAVFAAYVAADFALGGRVTGWLLGGLAALRGRVPGISTTGGDGA